MRFGKQEFANENKIKLHVCGATLDNSHHILNQFKLDESA